MERIIINDDLHLRTWKEQDTDELYSLVHHNRSHLHPWLEWVDKTTRPEHSRNYILDSLHDIEVQASMSLAVIAGNQIAGSVGMHHWDHLANRAEIGYWIAKKHEGKGIITASLTAFAGFLFRHAGLNKLEIHFLTGNRRSAAVAARLGFKTEGIIRQCVLRNGILEDKVIMGLLKSEWAVR